MNSEKLNSWLTLGANVGVVIGLVLLIVEIRQNSALVRAQIHQARSDNYVAMSVDIADSEYLLPAYQKFAQAGGWGESAALEALDPVETERIRRYAQGRLAGYDNLFYQYRQGYIDESFYQSRIVSSIKKMSPFWIEFGLLKGVTPEFRAEVERIISDG